MKATNRTVLMTHEDYQILNSYVQQGMVTRKFDSKNAALLGAELKRATLVKGAELPADIVRLNSKVTVQEGSGDRLIELTLVVPDKADIKARKISVFAPLGTALIGFRQGEKVKWSVPSGNKTFTIVKVCN